MWDDEAMQWQRPMTPTITDQSEVAPPIGTMATPAPTASTAPVSPNKPKASKQSEPMTEDELRAKLRPLFDKFDIDGSGSISLVEMTGILMQLKIKMSPEQINTMMKEADPDGSGEIDFEGEYFRIRTRAPCCSLLIAC